MPWSDHEDHFFEKLKETMILRGLTNRGLSLMIGAGRESYISSLLSNRSKPRIDMLYLISEALDIRLIELISKDANDHIISETNQGSVDQDALEALASSLRHCVSRQPPYHYLHEVWEEGEKKLRNMTNILPYLDLFAALEEKPWLSCKQIGEITLTQCALLSTDVAKYQHEIETSLVDTMRAASENYRNLSETMSANVARRSLSGKFADGYNHSITYIAHILPCYSEDGKVLFASFTTPISYNLNRVRVL